MPRTVELFCFWFYHFAEKPPQVSPNLQQNLTVTKTVTATQKMFAQTISSSVRVSSPFWHWREAKNRWCIAIIPANPPVLQTDFLFSIIKA